MYFIDYVITNYLIKYFKSKNKYNFLINNYSN